MFFFLQREIATSAGKNLRQIYSDSWYNLYSNAVLDIGDIMVAITSFGSELDVEEKYTKFSEEDFEAFNVPYLESDTISFVSVFSPDTFTSKFCVQSGYEANDPCEVQIIEDSKQIGSLFIPEDEYRSLRPKIIIFTATMVSRLIFFPI